MQTAASAVLIAGVVLTPGVGKFLKRLASPTGKAAPLLMKEMEKLGPGVADEIAKKLGKKLGTAEGEALMRACLADALEKNGAIGPYQVMKQFTDKLGGQWQAHHILEVRMLERFELGNAAKVPAVILTEAEHKALTAELRVATLEVEKVQDLWKAYQKVYRKYPHWLEAIKPYFVKGK